MEYRDRKKVIVLIGVLLLTVGIFAAFLGPLEIYVFYWFSEGGRFYYPGFGFGSFMFGNMTWQIVGYYLIALLCIPLGYGHIKVRRWSRSLMIALIWCWLVLGVPLLVVFTAILFSTKELSPVFGLVVLALLILSYLLLPWLFIRFYNGSNARLTFEAMDRSTYWIENLPKPVLVLGILFVFYVIVLHIPIFFNGLYPIFGTWFTGFRGILALDLTILFLVFLTWGIFKRKDWAWWGGVVFICVFTISLIFTLWNTSYQELLTLMNFPSVELDFLSGLPLQGIHFAAFVGLPLVLTLVVLITSKRYFGIFRPID